MLKKKMAAGIVALAMFSTLGLAACDGGGSGSGGGGSTAAAARAATVAGGQAEGAEHGKGNNACRHLLLQHAKPPLVRSCWSIDGIESLTISC